MTNGKSRLRFRMREWAIYQLCDSTFPTGGFVHSGGVEAAFQMGRIKDPAALEEFLAVQVAQTLHGSMPFVIGAYREPDHLAAIDAECEAFLTNHIARRASRMQGRAFLRASAAFAEPAIQKLDQRVRSDRLAGHFAPLFGAVLRQLQLGPEQVARTFLFQSLRAMVSASVRLGIAGPIEAQAMQFRLSRTTEELLTHWMRAPANSAVQTAPLADLIQATQDRLYSRLFQS